LPVIVRASPHSYNTEAEVDCLLDVVAGFGFAEAVSVTA
jgi:selenocysteine lyase/cysteine desulfurase